jgi:hypothetical protein
MENTKPTPYDVTGAIIDYEDGALTRDETIELFQHLINTGLAWTLQGSYGRMARNLIEAGLCSTPSGKRLLEVAS